ncbi:hypothetical protein LTR10_021478 [Elasticomyces elasticus]|uniref:RNA polymerase II subunit B1 CTD phosphatase RPAP2 homolog n=1 Tax=Exophiala sideris TaxID=1016849 RepID=A0ABR0J9G1_9EURO|nr:hypothetical protein LTR10_021478 [Elasticomyces elasticus]KAK5027816.1 hypothetical protein LTS07_006691 [Exophiala sideris]KAK5037596.1 hypothetical protein LTR13_004755 [Exophiala sideris]KAK5059258.1 hypothetical protein LTR69_006548 [Exophiala sideris]KAK5183092.1 hypothetical protein LTR44_004803 [Eurotiomycetes sp. CCFEE 6388]
MNTENSKSDVQKRIRTTALRQAQEIEERKNLQARIADLVVEAFDLPSNHDADPARPEASDASLFKQCLGLFQSTDLDDLIYERNIDNRCGYALCPRPNQRLSHNGELIWNKQAGKDFKLVNKAEMERWCSPLCQQRTIFVRAQLGTEPAWLRDVRAVEIKLYDEVAGESLADSLNTLSLAKAGDEDLTDKLQALALERGEININSNNEPVPLVEKESDSIPKPPSLKSKQSGKIEGHQPRKVRFHET